MHMQSPFLNVVVRKFAGARARRTPRPPESRPPTLSNRGESVRALPAFRRADPGPYPAERKERTHMEARAPETGAWPSEHCANEPGGFFPCVEQNGLWALGARVALALAWLA